MIPSEDVEPMDHTIRIDGERELVAVACVSEEQQVIERHVDVTKTFAPTRTNVVLDDAIQGPDETETVLASNAIRLAKQ